MIDLIVTDLVGNTEMLVGASVTRKINISNEKSITIEIMADDQNKEVFHLMKNQCLVIYENEEYVIKKINYKTLGGIIKATIHAYYKFYEDFNNNRIYDNITGTFRLEQFADFIFKNSGYEYMINNTGLSNSGITVENFGDDSLLSLLNTIVNRFDVEFEVQEKRVLIAKEHSRYMDIQMRYEFNINDPNLEFDSTNLKTYIKGFGKQDDETGHYLAYQEYTSPLAEIYGIKHAQPVRDERFTHNNTLLQEMKSRLIDYINMSLTLTARDLKEMGMKDVRVGDYVWCIIEPFDLDIQLRVIEVEDYSDKSKSPKFTFGSSKIGATQIINNWKEAQNTLDKLIIDGSIRAEALPSNVRQSTQAIATVSNAVSFTSEGFATSSVNTRNAIPDILFGRGQLIASGETVVSKHGLNLATVYGSLPQSVINEIINQVEIPSHGIATETTAGLMSAGDKRKLNQINTEAGESYDLSFFRTKISELERRIKDLEERSSIDG